MRIGLFVFGKINGENCNGRGIMASFYGRNGGFSSGFNAAFTDLFER